MKKIHPLTISKASEKEGIENSGSLIDPQKILTIGSRIDLKVEYLRTLVSIVLDQEGFDETFYVKTYQDVARAVQLGAYRSGFMHYKEIGFWEGRLPHAFEVDEEWYKTTYPDIKVAMDRKIFRTAAEHFISHGYKEGRRPNAEIDWLR